MKKVAILLLFLFLFLTGCNNKYVTHRTVSIMKEYNANTSYKCEFVDLIGTTVIKVKLHNNSEGDFKYIASLSKGEVKVSYQFLNNTLDLFTIKANQELNSHGGYIEDISNIYLFIEAKELSSGTIYIEWN